MQCHQRVYQRSGYQHQQQGVCRTRHNGARRSVAQATVAAAAPAQLEDKFLAKNLPPLHELPASPSVQDLRSTSWTALASLRMPSTRNEEYRFTDISPLLRTTLEAAQGDAPVSADFVANMVPQEAAQTYVVVVNGIVRDDLSNCSGVPKDSYVGSITQAPQAVQAKLGQISSARGGPFSVLNGAAVRDVLVISLPKGATVTSPVYILNLSTNGVQGTAASAPRLLLHAAQGASCTLVEEWASTTTDNSQQQQPAQQSDSSSTAVVPYFACAVAELFLEEDAQVSHGYVVREASAAVHIKATLVDQAESSSYSLTEARLGGGLTRHDVGVVQSGPSTNSSMRHFVLAGAEQLHDLHTKLALDHPEGQANQLHKCIVTSSSGRGVFDGNVRVGRYAQRTDAGQLSRNLLLAPRATVNVKPNLQIIADDVKCTHGCAVSDLSDEELFYFRARGISALAARQALVASFGAEVTQGIKLPALQTRIAADVRSILQNVDLAALQD